MAPTCGLRLAVAQALFVTFMTIRLGDAACFRSPPGSAAGSTDSIDELGNVLVPYELNSFKQSYDAAGGVTNFAGTKYNIDSSVFHETPFDMIWDTMGNIQLRSFFRIQFQQLLPGACAVLDLPPSQRRAFILGKPAYRMSNVLTIDDLLAQLSLLTYTNNGMIDKENFKCLRFKFVPGSKTFYSYATHTMTTGTYVRNKGRYVHEITHALGLEHEQQRNDRDDYVHLGAASIYDANNYYNGCETFGTLFDYASATLYPGDMLGGYWKFTYRFFLQGMPKHKWDVLSDGDIYAVMKHADNYRGTDVFMPADVLFKSRYHEIFGYGVPSSSWGAAYLKSGEEAAGTPIIDAENCVQEACAQQKAACDQDTVAGLSSCKELWGAYTAHGGDHSFVLPGPPGMVVGSTAAEVDARELAASEELERLMLERTKAAGLPANVTFNVAPKVRPSSYAEPLAPSSSLVLFEDLRSCIAQADDVCAIVMNKAEAALAAAVRSSKDASTGCSGADHCGSDHADPWHGPGTVVVVLLSAMLLAGIGIAIVRPATAPAALTKVRGSLFEESPPIGAMGSVTSAI